MKLEWFQALLIATTLLELNPLLQTFKILKTKEVSDISVGTYLMIFAIGAIWFIYGVQLKDPPIIIGNTIKLVASFSVIVVYFLYRGKQDRKNV